MKDIQIKVGIVITDKKGRVLLIKERYNKSNRYRWNIVKGTFGDIPNETIFDAAKRECKEEADVKVKLIGLIDSGIINNKKKLRVQYNFLAKVLSAKPELPSRKDQKKRNEDISNLKWFSRKETKFLKPKDFLSLQSFFVLKKYLKGKVSPLTVFRHY